MTATFTLPDLADFALRHRIIEAIAQVEDETGLDIRISFRADDASQPHR